MVELQLIDFLIFILIKIGSGFDLFYAQLCFMDYSKCNISQWITVCVAAFSLGTYYGIFFFHITGFLAVKVNLLSEGRRKEMF